MSARLWLPVLAAAVALATLSPARAEVTQRGDLRVSFGGRLKPHRLPRSGTAPVKVSFTGRIGTIDGSAPPQLRRIAIEINRDGRLDRAGVPVCRMGQIQPASNANALLSCARAKVGEGTFSADVLLPSQAPFPSVGKILAFNGLFHGRAAILVHVYGTQPVPTSYTLPFLITRRRQGAFRTVLSASLPKITSGWGYVTGMSITLGRTFRSHGRVHGYLRAGCSAPSGFPGAVFTLARASFGFRHEALSVALTRSCRARGR